MVQLSSRYGLWGGYELYLKTMILESVYPVGSVYISLTDSRNPSDILGFGTWEAMPAGYGLVAQGTATAEDGSTLKFTVGQKSGEFKHRLSNRELPKVSGSVEKYLIWGNSRKETGVLHSSVGSTRFPSASTENAYDSKISISFGGDQYHNNVSPCIAAYVWKRTK